MSNIPIKESMPKYCKRCGGTGKDHGKTEEHARSDADFRHRVKHHGSYIRCWSCNGNGLDPAEYFRWKGAPAT